MQKYDVTLKLLLQGSARLTMHALTGGAVKQCAESAGGSTG